MVQVQRVRDFRWPADGPPSRAYVDRSFDLRRLERVWFVQEPFTMPLFYGWEGVAHTYFVFDFQDQPPVAVSVESRRERGEGFDALRGLVNEYELIYVWGTERDLTGRRAVLEKNQLYMYPGRLDGRGPPIVPEHCRSVAGTGDSTTLLQHIHEQLHQRARQSGEPGSTGGDPAARRPHLSGRYSDGLLYNLGFIPNDAPLETVRQRYAITDAVEELVDQPDFSRLCGGD